MSPSSPSAVRFSSRSLCGRLGRAVMVTALIGFAPLLAQTAPATSTATPPPAKNATPTPLPAPRNGRSPGNNATEGAPALNWVLPIFTDKEGYRSMTLRGSEVRPFKGGVFVTDLNITIFTGTATPAVDSMLLSPVARFMPKENRAEGDKAVRFIRDDIEVTGIGWTYDHAAKKISLQQNVRVTFSAQLNDILK